MIKVLKGKADIYKNKWIVLSNDEKRVVAYDDSFLAAFKKAKELGEEKPYLIKIPSGEIVLI